MGAVVSFQVTLEMPRKIAVLLNGIFTSDLPKVCYLSSISAICPVRLILMVVPLVTSLILYHFIFSHKRVT